MKKLVSFALVALVLFSVSVGAAFAQDSYFSQDYNGTVGVGYWMPSINGGLNIGPPANAATTIDFKNDLNMANASTVIADFRHKFDNVSSLYVGYFSLNNTGSVASGRTYTWRTYRFNAGNQVDSALNLKMADFIYEKKIYENDQAYLCGTLGIKYGTMHFNINNSTLGSSVPSSAKGVIPVIGLFGKTKMNQNLNGLARLNFMNGTSGSLNGNVFDLLAGLSWDFYQNWSGDFGYKWFSLKGTNTSTNDQLTINQVGPFVQFRFSY